MQNLSMEQAADAWRWNLDTYAKRVSGGKWLPYRWHVYLAQRLIEAVLAGNARIIVTAPPRHGKSELTSRWLSTWFLDMFPDKRVILSSYAAALATDWSEKVRDTFDGRNAEVWTRLDQNHALKGDWRTTAGGGMRAVGVGGGITGFGADLLAIDDPIKDWYEAQSPAALRRVVDWFNGTLYHRLEPGGSIILIQTRWSEADLAGYLIDEHEDDWVEIRMPALAGEDDLLGRREGEALCPERYDEAQLAKIRRAVGAQVFAGLFQQLPAPAEGNIIKREWIKYYGGPTGIELPEELRQFQSWDLNFGEETARGSFVVGQVWGEGGGAWLLDQVRGRWDFVETKDQLKKLSKRWPQAREKLVENKAAGAPLISDLRGSVMGLLPKNPKGSKTARLMSVAPFFESGDVWFPHPSIAPWVPELVEEIVTIPNAENDDQGDTLSQALASCARGMDYDITFGGDSLVRESPWTSGW